MIALGYMMINLFQEKYGDLLYGTISLEETQDGVNMIFTNNFFLSIFIILVISFIIIFPIIKTMDKKNTCTIKK